MKENNILIFFKKNDIFTCVLLTIIFELFIYLLGPGINKYSKTIIPLFMVVSICIFFLSSKKMTWKKNGFYLIYILGVILRTIYILNTSIYMRQYDVLTMFEDGHLGYIYTLFKTCMLPLTNHWQFYHPPLWHILGALWLQINSLFKVGLNYSFEGLQILSLLFSAFLVLIVDRICIKLKLDIKYRYIVDLLVAVHPTFIRFSGSINNDCLLLLMECLTIWQLINVYDRFNMLNIIKLAIITGLCVMTKANGAMVAAPIIYIFLIKFIEVINLKKDTIHNFLLKIFVFGIISLPIGLWYQFRNYIRYSKLAVPVPSDWLYVGNHTIASRLFTVNFKELFQYADPSKDYNMPSYLIKTSLFGEFKYINMDLLAKMMVVFNILLIIIFMIFFIKYIIKKEKNVYVNIQLIMFITLIVSMYLFNIKYPFACSMDIRYIAYIIILMVTLIGHYLNNLSNKIFRNICSSICLIFSVLSIIFVFMI